MRRAEKALSLLIGASLAASVSTALLRDDGDGTALPPLPTPSFTESPFPTFSPEPTDTLSPEPTDTFSPEPTDTGTPEPTDTALPGPTDTPTESPVESPTPEPTETDLPSPTPTSTVRARLPKTGVGGYPAAWLLVVAGAAGALALRRKPRAL